MGETVETRKRICSLTEKQKWTFVFRSNSTSYRPFSVPILRWPISISIEPVARTFFECSMDFLLKLWTFSALTHWSISFRTIPFSITSSASVGFSNWSIHSSPSSLRPIPFDVHKMLTKTTRKCLDFFGWIKLPDWYECGRFRKEVFEGWLSDLDSWSGEKIVFSRNSAVRWSSMWWRIFVSIRTLSTSCNMTVSPWTRSIVSKEPSCKHWNEWRFFPVWFDSFSAIHPCFDRSHNWHHWFNCSHLPSRRIRINSCRFLTWSRMPITSLRSFSNDETSLRWINGISIPDWWECGRNPHDDQCLSLLGTIGLTGRSGRDLLSKRYDQGIRRVIQRSCRRSSMESMY